VDVRRDEPPRVKRVLDDRERSPGHLGGDLEVDADTAKPYRLALACLNDDLELSSHLRSFRFTYMSID
jgi:hypothetical protein